MKKLFFLILCSFSFTSNFLFIGVDAMAELAYKYKINNILIEKYNSEISKPAITFGYNHLIKKSKKVNFSIGGSYTAIPTKYDSAHEIGWLSLYSLASFPYSIKTQNYEGWILFGLSESTHDFNHFSLGLTYGIGCDFIINKKISLSFGYLSNEASRKVKIKTIDEESGEVLDETSHNEDIDAGRITITLNHSL